LNLLKSSLIVAGILLTLLPVVLFRSPPSTRRTGNELAMLSWIIAESQGEGSVELFPITMSITIENGCTSSFIENCGKTVPPDLRLQEGIPFPLDYRQVGNDVTIVFSEVPEHE
jgi:hypothetical protein